MPSDRIVPLMPHLAILELLNAPEHKHGTDKYNSASDCLAGTRRLHKRDIGINALLVNDGQGMTQRNAGLSLPFKAGRE